jgi:demethylmenaquinone methyltransferase/2-methoxy-6-polyprenyl-1,4-benzoquinol methylase
MSMGEKTHFGYTEVDASRKASLVGEVFRSVASRYDLMNDLMSMGVHRLWKRFAAAQSGLRPGDRVLDVAAGSGDMSRLFAPQVGAAGRVVVTDINSAMLEQGRARLMDAGITGNVTFSLADAENLCFPDAEFHCACIAFGLRNVTRKEQALAEMCRVLKPGGRLLVLEFSRPLLPLLEKAYDAYSFNVIPKIGSLVAGDEESYRYLVESIRKHPDQETLKGMMRDAGFDHVRVNNLSGGIVALHTGFRY